MYVFSLDGYNLGWHGQTRLPVGRGEGMLPLYCEAVAHRVQAKRGQDGLAMQGRDALATVRPHRVSTVKRVWRCHPEHEGQAKHVRIDGIYDVQAAFVNHKW